MRASRAEAPKVLDMSGSVFLRSGAWRNLSSGLRLGGFGVFRSSPQPTPDGTKAQVPAQNGLVAWFKSENAAKNWPNEVKGGEAAQAPDATVKTESGHGAKGKVKFISGNTGVKVDFGPILKNDYTICSVARYTGGSKGRILDCNNKNWLHGHWASQVGVAHYQTWNTNSRRNGGNKDWLVICGSDGKQVYLGSNPDKNIATKTGRAFGGGEHRLVTNRREKSDFAIMEVMVWKRKLAHKEMKDAMNYLNAKLENGIARDPDQFL